MSTIQIKNLFDKYSKKQTFERGEIVFQQGDNVNLLHWVYSGSIKRKLLSISGEELTLEMVIGGQLMSD